MRRPILARALDTTGASSVEITLMVTLVALFALGSWSIFGGAVERQAQCAADAIENGSAGACGASASEPGESDARDAQSARAAATAATEALGADGDVAVAVETSAAAHTDALGDAPSTRTDALADAVAPAGANALADADADAPANADANALANADADAPADADANANAPADADADAPACTNVFCSLANGITGAASWVWDRTEGARDWAAGAATWSLGLAQRITWLTGVPIVMPSQWDDYLEFRANLLPGMGEWVVGTVKGVWSIGEWLVSRQASAWSALWHGDAWTFMKTQLGIDLIEQAPKVLSAAKGIAMGLWHRVDTLAVGDAADAGRAGGALALDVASVVLPAALATKVARGAAFVPGSTDAAAIGTVLGTDASSAVAAGTALVAEGTDAMAIGSDVIRASLAADGIRAAEVRAIVVSDGTRASVRYVPGVRPEDGVWQIGRDPEAVGVYKQAPGFGPVRPPRDPETVGVYKQAPGFGPVRPPRDPDTVGVYQQAPGFGPVRPPRDPDTFGVSQQAPGFGPVRPPRDPETVGVYRQAAGFGPVRPPRDPATIGVYKQPIGFRPPSAIFVPTVRAVRLPDGSILIGYFID